MYKATKFRPTHELRFHHWKHGPVARDVVFVGIDANNDPVYADRATLYRVSRLLPGNVYKVGRIVRGEPRPAGKVHIGWDARATTVLSEGWAPRCRHSNYRTPPHPETGEPAPYCPVCDEFVDL